MIENHMDRKGGNVQTIDGREHSVWNHLKRKSRLSLPFRQTQWMSPIKRHYVTHNSQPKTMTNIRPNVWIMCYNHASTLADTLLFFNQLDVLKAFNRLEYPFLFWILEAYNFGPLFISFVKATIVGASSTVLFNGKFTRPFPICRSIRQGCLLLAILFVIAIDVLNQCLTQSTALGRIWDVPFAEHGFQVTHGLYVDDIHLFLRDDPVVLHTCQSRFNDFGELSGLFCDWQNKSNLPLFQCDPKFPPTSRMVMGNQQKCIEATWHSYWYFHCTQHHGNSRYLCQKLEAALQNLNGNPYIYELALQSLVGSLQ